MPTIATSENRPRYGHSPILAISAARRSAHGDEDMRAEKDNQTENFDRKTHEPIQLALKR